MRFAKLEQNIITAFFCATFDFELADKKGRRMESPVAVNTNNFSAAKPEKEMFLKYTLRKEVP